MSNTKIAQKCLSKLRPKARQGHHQPRTEGDEGMKALFWGQRRLRLPFPEGEELLREQKSGQSSPSFQAARPAVGTVPASQNQQAGFRKVA